MTVPEEDREEAVTVAGIDEYMSNGAVAFDEDARGEAVMIAGNAGTETVAADSHTEEKRAPLVEVVAATEGVISGRVERQAAAATAVPDCPVKAATRSEPSSVMTRTLTATGTLVLPTAVEALATSLGNGSTTAARRRYRRAEDEVAAVRGYW